MSDDPGSSGLLRDFVRAGFSAAGVPGGVVQVVDSAGVVDAVSVGDLTAEWPVMLGSTSKSLTALGLLCAVEDGALSLDSAVRRWLPEVDLPADVTVGDLAHHCSGLTTDSTPGHHHHGSDRRFRYANQNYNLLGEVIAIATGVPFDQWMARRVFEPFGLTHTFCAGHERDGEVAPGHVGVFGRFARARLGHYGSNEWIQPASGAICSSAADAGRVLRLLLNDGAVDGVRVLSQNSIRTMLHDTVATHSSPAVDGPLGPNGDYGFGWVRKDLDGEDVFVHVGKVPAHTSVFALMPGRGLGMVLVANAGDFLVATPLLEDLADGVIRRLLGRTATPISASVRRTRRAVVNACYLGLLGIGAAGWLIPKSSGTEPARLGYHVLLPLALALGVRRMSQTPLRWSTRFVPDASAVLVTAAVSMFASGVPGCLRRRALAQAPNLDYWHEWQPRSTQRRPQRTR